MIPIKEKGLDIEMKIANHKNEWFRNGSLVSLMGPSEW